MNEHNPADLTAADLASVGLTMADGTPELLAGLDETSRLLAEAPVPEPPADLVRRWDAALAGLTPPTPVSTEPSSAPPSTGRPGGRRSPGRRTGRWLAGAAAAAGMAAATVALVALPGALSSDDRHGDTSPTAHPGAGSDRGQALSVRDLPLGGHDYGPLTDPDRRAGCLGHVGAPGSGVLGARQVSWAGRPGVLLVVPTPVPGRLRVLVVSPDCGPTSGNLLADATAGR